MCSVSPARTSTCDASLMNWTRAAWEGIAAVQVPYRRQWAVAYQAPDAQRRQAQHGVASSIRKPFIEMSADEHVGALWEM